MYFCCFRIERDDRLEKRREAPRPAIPLDTIIRGMAQGTVMYKVKDTERYYRRKYKVDVQNMRLTYSPSKIPWCGKKLPVVDLYDIEDVRRGWGTDVFNEVESKLKRRPSLYSDTIKDWVKEENCFSIICSERIINLIAPNSVTRDAWVRGLRHLLATCKNTHLKEAHSRWLKEQVRKADVDQNGYLSFDECLILLRQLNISMDKKEVRQLFDTANFRKAKINGQEALDAEEFVRFYDGLTRREELLDLMRKYSVSRTTILGADELQNFLLQEQKTNLSLEECENLIDLYEPEEDRIPGYLSAKGFEHLLLSVDGQVMNKRHRIIYQDMKHPLSHYYIASSHNTYLMRGQLVGKSSVEGYVQALLKGCRCLELDTWDGPDGEPIVFHGYTLTSRILLRDILESIKKYAFKSSQYPVILSIENHCSLPYQVTMAEHFVSILGEYLYKEPIGDDEEDFPSPEELARKILIKAKKIKTTQEDEVQLLEEEEEQEQEMAVRRATLELEMAEMVQASSTKEEEAEQSAELKEGAEALAELPPAAPPRKYGQLAQELSDLVNYCSATRFTTFEDCKKNWKFYQMASFQETKALRISSDDPVNFVAHNKTHLTRIYPKGTRTDSSNYDPVPFWNVGCQMVALNYQTWDKYMHLHESKFAQNGKCGYILKPRFLYDKSIPYDPNEKPDSSFQRSLLIKIISAQQIPKPRQRSEGEIVDPYVTIEVTGHPVDVQKKKTSYIHNNGFNPEWNEMFLFCLAMPELAMLTFKVKDQNFTGKNEVLAQYTIPFMSMSEGYRHIQLEDTRGHLLVPGSLFVHITIGSSHNPKPYKDENFHLKPI